MMPLIKGQITGISPTVPARRRAVIIQPLPNGTDYLPDDQSQGLGTKTIYCDATTGVWQYDLPSNGEHTCYLVNTESGSEFIKVPDTENQRGWWWDYEIPSYYGGQFELVTVSLEDLAKRDLSNVQLPVNFCLFDTTAGTWPPRPNGTYVIFSGSDASLPPPDRQPQDLWVFDELA
jgi:hypothetical protein